MKMPNDMKPESLHATNSYGELRVISYADSKNIYVEFVTTKSQRVVSAKSIRNGSVKDLMLPSIYGVGYIGDGVHSSSISGRLAKPYTVWVSMLCRCYSDIYHKRQPTYIGCSVCDEWHNFQNFADWFKENYIDGYELDKDVRVSGNKTYSPSLCEFVSPNENRVKAAAKSYKFKDPSGNTVNVYNLSELARKEGLMASHMSQVNLGNRKSHKGWTKA